MNLHCLLSCCVFMPFPYLPWTDLSQAPPGSRSWTRWMILHRQPVKTTNKIEATVVAFSEERPMAHGFGNPGCSVPPLLLVWLSWCGTSVLRWSSEKCKGRAIILRRRPAIKASSKFITDELEIFRSLSTLNTCTISHYHHARHHTSVSVCKYACHPCPPSCRWSMSDDELE